ncbi:MAG TPA: M3 family metallopeptidase [Gemmatimonadaceae bacterium]|nr:M3 family metallopeptidase [Gemmatimonadaceae bacterium]
MTSSSDILADDNPFAVASPLPFGAPAFDRIRDEHFEPAIEEGMRRHLAEVEAIANQSAAPTFENTLAALERSGDLLTRVLKVFGVITSANTNDALQSVQSRQAPKLAAHNDAIHLNDRLFTRVRCLHEQRSTPGLDAEQSRLVERYYIEFVRSGARLPESDKAHLRLLNQEESTLTTEFQNRLLAANKAGALVVDDIADLEGLSEADVAAAAEAAEDRHLVGKWVLTLQNTTMQRLQESLARRDVRERLFGASVHRADRGDTYDTRGIIKRLAEVRAERARLLGYASNAAYVLEDQMAKTPEQAISLLTRIGAAAAAKARDEAARMQALVRRTEDHVELQPWDWAFYAEQLRKAEYDLDESHIKVYFELDRVLVDGVFYASNRLFGLSFRETAQLPVYHPDVRAFEVYDAEGALFALFYCDFFKRDNKSGGAWMDSFVDQSHLLASRPVVVNVCNFTRPAAGQPALLSFDEVTTMFHEFGHTLHGMLSDVVYPTLSGTNTPRDFVEFPSQFNEHWALEPTVFERYARHHETSEPMPQSLVDKIKKSRTFNQGFALTEYVAAAQLDMAWHTLAPGDTPGDVAGFERQALERYGMDVREVPPRYRSTYFAHIWDGGYEAGYYAYLWAEVLDHDAFAWFEERGGMTRENGRIFREQILSRGGTRNEAEMYRSFRGREPSVEPLLVARGLKPAATA